MQPMANKKYNSNIQRAPVQSGLPPNKELASMPTFDANYNISALELYATRSREKLTGRRHFEGSELQPAGKS